MLEKIIIGLILFFGFLEVGNAEGKCEYKIFDWYDKITSLNYDSKNKTFNYRAKKDWKYFISNSLVKNYGLSAQGL